MDRILGYIIVIIIVGSQVIPRDVIPVSLIMTVALLLSIIYGKDKYNWSELFITLFVATIGVVTNDIYAVLSVALSIYLILSPKIEKHSLSPKLNMLLFGLAVSATYIAGHKVDYSGQERFVTIVGDPNFSSLILFTLSLLVIRANRALFIICNVSFLFLFQSRMHLLMLILIMPLVFRERSGLLLQNAYKYRVYLYVVPMIAVLAFSSIVHTVMLDTIDYNASGIRLLELSDRSNIGRFSSIADNTDYILGNAGQLMFSSMEEEKMSALHPVLPHNSVLYSILRQGIVVTMIVILSLIKMLMVSNNRDYVYCILVYLVAANFLHGMYSMVFMLPFLIIAQIQLRKSD